MQNDNSLVISGSENLKKSLEEQAENSLPLKVEMIPLIIFNDLADNLGMGEEFHLSLNGFNFRIHKLNPEHRATGFQGAIGFGHSPYTQHTSFCLWGRVPEGSDSVFESKPLVRLVAGEQRVGMWSVVGGDYMEHRIYADFSMDNPNLKNPAIALMALVLLRANHIARDPKVVSEAYWWDDKYKKTE
jgi:hypothetical protein